MKRVLTNLLTISGIMLLMLASCKKNDALVTTNGGTPGTLSASVATLQLDKTKLADTSAAITFNITAPKYTYKAAATNTLQIDAAGDNWQHPTSVTLNNKALKQSYSTASFNALLLKLNLPAGQASTVNVRVQHALSSTEVVYSNVISLSVTPFNLTSYIYAVGAFQGWNASSPDSLVSVTGNGIYVGIINFTAGNNQFLILPAKNYNNKYATSTTTVPTSSVTYNASNNINAPTAAGQYLVTFNLNAGTISFALANHYSVIGDAALGWNATGDDTEMKYVNDGNGNWVVTLPLASTGSFKIRQNDDWTWSWGVPQAGSDGAGIPNTLNDNKNNNISVATSGTYTVTFNDPASPASSPTPTTTTATYSVK